MATAGVGIPAIILVDWLGGITFGLVVALTSIVGAWELWSMARTAGRRSLLPASALGAAAAAVVPLAVHRPQGAWIGIVLLVLVVAAAYYLLPRHASDAASGWALTVMPVLYVGLLVGHLSLLRVFSHGARWVLAVLLMTWAYDTGAFFAGRSFGRHPFMQHISPAKTVEGVWGGVLACVIAALVTVPTIGLFVWQAALLGLVVGPVAQLGDLIESMLKRQFGVKDSGAVIPGHGGLLDRIDSLLLTGAVTAYAAYLLGYGS